MRGQLVQKSEPPKPGSVPYPDRLIALHLKDVRLETEEPFAGEMVVFVWLLEPYWSEDFSD